MGLCFNSRAHVGRDRALSAFIIVKIVSIHAPTRGATNNICRNVRERVFQFTRPRGARLILEAYKIDFIEFQFTRPRGARPLINFLSSFIPLVSIHAPTRGATVTATVIMPPLGVSIHAPTRGATCFCSASVLSNK